MSYKEFLEKKVTIFESVGIQIEKENLNKLRI